MPNNKSARSASAHSLSHLGESEARGAKPSEGEGVRRDGESEARGAEPGGPALTLNAVFRQVTVIC